MANTTYSIPVTPSDRAVDVLEGVAIHLVAWKREYNIDLVSITRNGANLDYVFSDPVPLAERKAIRITVT